MNPLLRRGLAGTTALALAGPMVALTAAPAHAAARITVTSSGGKATAATDGATTLTVKGRGFQSIEGGAGGIYVAFGWVSDPTGDSWKPSQGGATGDDYRYVPDSESADNAGHQRFLAFPGSDTASSANGTLSASGGFTTTLSVPGARFSSVDRSGKAVEVDCTEVTCGVLTIGAHGIKSPRNETFTPVRFAASSGSTVTQPSAGAAVPADAAPTAATPTTPARTGTAAVAVDRATAVVGRVLTFTGTSFQPGEQVVATLDDGVAAVGPLAAGQSGEVAGVLQLPATIEPGTHVMRLTGAASGAVPEVTFAIAAAPPVVDATAAEAADEGPTTAAWVFLAVAGVLLLAAVVGAVLRVRRARRAQATQASSTAQAPSTDPAEAVR
ncbi:hypothetical protein [Mumia sp. ZJ430]|uniref:hypothetical protein n=1 Tax=Mumia sp. ZJ430 TaxID=2708083 RepID=UPI00141DDB9F|nr:hypothetical protein [Mumia sp. ZJ430]